jgi:hypothetical protein
MYGVMLLPMMGCGLFWEVLGICRGEGLAMCVEDLVISMRDVNTISGDCTFAACCLADSDACCSAANYDGTQRLTFGLCSVLK